MILRLMLYTLAVVALIVAIVVTVGYSLPESHVASRERVITLPPEQVFARLVDVAQYPSWRVDVEAVDVISAEPLTWRERSRGDVITYEVVERTPPSRLVAGIADPSLPFGGRWTYELTREGSGTRVRITENGEVYNPVFRFMSRFVFGHTANIDRVLAALEP